MAISVQNLRSGALFTEDGKIYSVIDYHHHKMGRGKAVIRVKVRDIESGNQRELTYNNNGSVEEVEAMKKNMEYVYTDERNGNAIFSDPDTKARINVPIDVIGADQLAYLRTGAKIQALINEQTNEIMATELPMTVDLEVEQTGPSDKGDTQGSARKPATLETGLIVQVPMFIKIGDLIRVNTQSGEYKERVS
ncbi:elongation factor P [candidate division WWE3 bacterium]|uniref:Elongation factor P n=1 Tax=candidate division WWE3 bacterium TaxID=2053526 RepID=A0A955RPP1_UNCKA|nr:elongation factor P [candidate division WWE3 bacterium]